MTTAIRTWDQAETRLAEIWPNYRQRPQQQKMAEAVTRTISGNSKHRATLAQAGCGVGKSLGYLIPAIASGKRVIVSVSTKALQDQLVGKDLPMLKETLFPQLTFANLKGRSNYVCQRAAAQSGIGSRVHPGSAGERQDLMAGAVPDETWAKISVDAEGCVGKACPFRSECYSEKARQAALSAQVLVVNTSLLTQDLRFRAMTRGKMSLLGDFDTLIVDEAHEMADIVSSGLSTRLTLRRIMDTTAKLAYHLDAPGAPEMIARLNETAAAYFNGAKSWFEQQRGKERTALLAEDDIKTLNSLVDALDPIRGEVAMGRCSCEPLVDEYGEEHSGCEFQKRVDSLMHDLTMFALSEGSINVVWMEQTRSGAVALMSSPAEVGGFLKAALWEPQDQEPAKAVLTSATLGVGGDFSYTARRLGLSAYNDLDVGTPFDYSAQARCYIPPADAPNPSKQRTQWLPWAQDQMFELVRAAGGGALLLFTSTSAMREAHESVGRRLTYLDQGINVMMQGDGRTNRELSAQFSADTHSVLFATRSFMTGVDFAGDTCRLVVIDKMPFPVPDEPVFQARCKQTDSKFGEGASFRRISIPEMSLVLIQAFGRLIRTVEDRGVVAILDPRMRAGWARPIRNSLPPAPQVGTVDEVRDFYQSMR